MFVKKGDMLWISLLLSLQSIVDAGKHASQGPKIGHHPRPAASNDGVGKLIESDAPDIT